MGKIITGDETPFKKQLTVAELKEQLNKEADERERQENEGKVISPIGTFVFVEIPESAYYNGNIKLQKPRLTGFLPVESVGSEASVRVHDGICYRNLAKDDEVMIEGIEYPLITYLGREFLVVNSYQIYAGRVVKRNREDKVPMDNMMNYITGVDDPFKAVGDTTSFTPSLTTKQK